MMDQTHIGYTYWQQPEVDKIPGVTTIDLPATPQMGVAIEGSPGWWPEEKSHAALPDFYPGQGGHYIDIFNRGKGKFKFAIESLPSFVTAEPKSGIVTTEQRIWVNVNWQQTLHGLSKVPVTITTENGDTVTVEAPVYNMFASDITGFNENNGYVSMEAAHYTKAINSAAVQWVTIPNYGRTLSGVTPSPVPAASQVPVNNGPRLEYQVNLIHTGVITIEAYVSPTIDFNNSNGLRYAISFDDELPQVININADKSEASWNKDVANNIKILLSKHHLSNPGRHVLKYWMVDPGVVLQKIVIDAGGVKESYLGPPESNRLSKK
jgi:hypothetical protein